MEKRKTVSQRDTESHRVTQRMAFLSVSLCPSVELCVMLLNKKNIKCPQLLSFKEEQAESLLIRSGFELLRSKGSHRIYKKVNVRVVVPFHSGKILHPKIIKQVQEAIEKTSLQ